MGASAPFFHYLGGVMADFTEQISYWVGSVDSYSNEVDQALLDSRADIIGYMLANRPDMVHKFSTTSELTDGGGLELQGYPAISSYRGDYVCHNGDPRYSRLYSVSTSIHYATPYNPVGYDDGDKYYVKPDPTADPEGMAYVTHVAVDGALSGSSSSIDYFPSNLYNALVYRASMQVLDAKMIEEISSVPSSINLPSLPVVPVFTDLSAQIQDISPPDAIDLTGADSLLGEVPEFSNIDFSSVKPVVAFVQPAPPSPPDDLDLNQYIQNIAESKDIDFTSIDSVNAFLSPEMSVPGDLNIASYLTNIPSSEDIDFSSVKSVEGFLSPEISVPDELDLTGYTEDMPEYADIDFSSIVKVDGFLPHDSNLPSEIDLDEYINNIPDPADIDFTLAPTVPGYKNSSDISPPSDIDLSSYIEDEPTLSDIDFSSTAQVDTFLSPSLLRDTPSFTAPTIAGSASFAGVIDTATIGNDTSINDVSRWFSAVGKYIEQEEDTELAMTNLQKISTFLNAYSTDFKNAVASYEKDVEAYRGELADFQSAVQAEADRVSSDIQINQQEINKAIAKYESELGGDIKILDSMAERKLNEFRSNLDKSIQVFQLNVQDEANRVSHDIQINQQEINKAISAYESEFNANLKIIDSKAAIVINEFKLNFDRAVQIFQANVAKYNAEVQRLTINNGNAFQSFSASLQIYSNDVQAESMKFTQEIQKVGSRYDLLSRTRSRLERLYKETIAAVFMASSA
jgi:hypothetical protein